MINLEDYGSGKKVIVDEGDYEVVLNFSIRPTKDGTSDYLNVAAKIRDDVDQKFAGEIIYTKLFKDKKNPDWHDLNQLGNILKTQVGKPGYTTKFDTEEEFIQYISDACAVVHVSKVFDDYYQAEVNRIGTKPWDNPYKPSALGPYQKKDPAAAPKPVTAPTPTTVVVDVPDTDLPF